MAEVAVIGGGIAGIQAAKRTSDLIPLCHPIAIHGVEVAVEVVDPNAVQVLVTVRTADELVAALERSYHESGPSFIEAIMPQGLS